MERDDEVLTAYERQLAVLWERTVRVIGLHTVNVLVERAIWETPQRHPELAFTKHGDDGLSFADLRRGHSGKPARQMAEAFGDLTNSLLLMFARLLGKDTAQRLAEELAAPGSTEQASDGRRRGTP